MNSTKVTGQTDTFRRTSINDAKTELPDARPVSPDGTALVARSKHSLDSIKVGDVMEVVRASDVWTTISDVPAEKVMHATVTEVSGIDTTGGNNIVRFAATLSIKGRAFGRGFVTRAEGRAFPKLRRMLRR